jgi:hypothetical protein
MFILPARSLLLEHVCGAIITHQNRCSMMCFTQIEVPSVPEALQLERIEE